MSHVPCCLLCCVACCCWAGLLAIAACMPAVRWCVLVLAGNGQGGCTVLAAVGRWPAGGGGVAPPPHTPHPHHRIHPHHEQKLHGPLRARGWAPFEIWTCVVACGEWHDRLSHWLRVLPCIASCPLQLSGSRSARSYAALPASVAAPRRPGRPADQGWRGAATWGGGACQCHSLLLCCWPPSVKGGGPPFVVTWPILITYRRSEVSTICKSQHLRPGQKIFMGSRQRAPGPLNVLNLSTSARLAHDLET